MEDRLTDLEVRIAYQDKVIEDLNQVVIELRKEIEFLTRKVDSLENSDRFENIKDLSQEVPPPHY